MAKGDLLITAKTEGYFYLDGQRLGQDGSGGQIRFGDLSMGSHAAEMHYKDGKAEKASVVILDMKSVNQGLIYPPPFANALIRIPAGSFTIGSPSTEPNRIYNEGLQHQVSLSAFQLGQREVTQGEWQTEMGTNPSLFKGKDRRPVERFSWYDILVYCTKRSLRENLRPCYCISGSTDPAAWGAVPANGNNATWDAVICDLTMSRRRAPI